MITRYLDNNREYFYLVFRVFVGLLFVQHGAQKLFGLFGGNAVEIFSLMGLAGIIEFFGGFLIAIGLFTRIAAAFGAADMIGAWFIGHISQGWIPIVNRGELALLYLACFILILAYGGRKFALDKKIFK